jgi:hypothetical protein
MYVANGTSKMTVSEPGLLTVILEVPIGTYTPYFLMMGC